MRTKTMTEERPALSSQTIPTEEFLTTHELMRILKIKNRLTIYSFIKQGMPVIRVGKSYRFIKSEVVEFFKARSLHLVKERENKK